MRKKDIAKPYFKKNGEKNYLFKIYTGVDPLTGKEKHTTRRGFKTKKEAELEYARLKLSIENGTFRKKRVETFQDVYDLWIQEYSESVESSTLGKTKGIFKNHILPKMSDYKIDKIDTNVCKKLIDEWASKLKKFRTVKYYAANVLDFAIAEGYINSNPFSFVKLKMKKTSREVSERNQTNNVRSSTTENYYNREQLVNFLYCLEKESNYRNRTFFRMLAYTGMRKGEALALTWDDIDFNRNEIHILKAVSLNEFNKLYVKSTKGKRARTIKIQESTKKYLNEWKEIQQKELLALGFDISNPRQLVFSNKFNEHIFPSKTSDWIRSLIKKHNLEKITTHGFRHTHCTLLYEAGAELKEIQEKLGHSDIKTTLETYTHLTPERRKETEEKFERYINF